MIAPRDGLFEGQLLVRVQQRHSLTPVLYPQVVLVAERQGLNIYFLSTQLTQFIQSRVAYIQYNSFIGGDGGERRLRNRQS